MVSRIYRVDDDQRSPAIDRALATGDVSAAAQLAVAAVAAGSATPMILHLAAWAHEANGDFAAARVLCVSRSARAARHGHRYRAPTDRAAHRRPHRWAAPFRRSYSSRPWFRGPVARTMLCARRRWIAGGSGGELHPRRNARPRLCTRIRRRGIGRRPHRRRLDAHPCRTGAGAVARRRGCCAGAGDR